MDIARDKSLENAKTEFKKFCSDSANCQNNAYVISPLRTDCEKLNGKYSCFRGLEYTILPQKRSAIYIDKNEINNLIANREKELSELRDNLRKAERLNELDKQIDEIKKLDQGEADLEYLKDHVAKDYVAPKVRKESVSITFSYLSLPIKNNSSSFDNVSFIGIGGYASTLIIWNTYLKIGARWISSAKSEPETASRGSPNSSSEIEYYGHTGFDLNLGLLVKIYQFQISPIVGMTSVKYKSVQQTYNGFGVANGKAEKTYSSTSSYIGVALRYGEKYFIEVEPRRLIKEKRSSISAEAGFTVDF